jgi:hypothetical protein
VLQGRAIQKLHGDKRTPIVLADFVDRADVGMIKSGRSAGLPPKTFQSLWVLRDIFRKKLQCDEAPELGVLGFVDLTHLAPARVFRQCDSARSSGRSCVQNMLWRKHRQVNERRASRIYAPLTQKMQPWKRWGAVIVKSKTSDPLSLAPALRQQIWSLDPQLPLTKVETMEEVMALSVAQTL